MAITVHIPLPLRTLTGGRAETEATGSTVAEVISHLDSLYPGMADRIYQGGATPNRFVSIFVNNQDIRLLAGERTPVADGDVITILPLIAGGRRDGQPLTLYRPDRYSRQTIFPGIGRLGQEKLARSTAVIVGCGALGTVTAASLARAGVGALRIIDRDFIEYHNLQRQVLFDEEDVRMKVPKAIAAERHLRAANSEIEVEGVVADVNHRNIERLVRGADVIVDGLDNLETRYLLNDASQKLGIPWIYGAAVASCGMMMAIVPGRTPCIRCLFPSPPPVGRNATCDTAGVVNAAPMLVGALQAAEAMKLMLGLETMGLVSVDVWSGQFSRLDVIPRPSPDCPACRGRYDFLDAQTGARTTSLCGQNAVQVLRPSDALLSFEELARVLRPLGDVEYNEFMLTFNVDGYEMVVFLDGRAIVKGTDDESVARGLYSKYIGM